MVLILTVLWHLLRQIIIVSFAWSHFRKLELKVRHFMSERGDYKAWYYKPVQAERYDIADQYRMTQQLFGHDNKYGGRPSE
jgi:hypothetical protein